MVFMWCFLRHGSADAHFPWGYTCTRGQMTAAAHWQPPVTEGAEEGVVLQ